MKKFKSSIRYTYYVLIVVYFLLFVGSSFNSCVVSQFSLIINLLYPAYVFYCFSQTSIPDNKKSFHIALEKLFLIQIVIAPLSLICHSLDCGLYYLNEGRIACLLFGTFALIIHVIILFGISFYKKSQFEY